MAPSPVNVTSSNLDVNGLVEKLMQVERQPSLKLKQKEVNGQAKISAYATLLSSVSSLNSVVSGLKDVSAGKSASSSDTSFFSATSDSSAVSGAHTINIYNIATAQSIYSTTFAAETSEVADLTTYTTQKLRIKLGSTTNDVTINSSNNTLSGIRDAINDADAGVTASIINSGYVIDSSSKAIRFTEGATTYTATLTEGTYTADALASEVKRAIEAANGSNTYTVSYDTATKKFSITSNSANSDSLDILWEDAITTAEGILGFTAADHSEITAGNSTTSDSAVGSYRLILTSDSTGISNRIIVQVDEDNDGTFEESGDEQDTTGLSNLSFNPTYNSDGTVSGGIANMTQSQVAVDAKLKVDNLEITRSGNTISDAITGVTITLLKGDTSTYSSASGNKTLTISDDMSSITGKVASFVSAYNTSMTNLKNLKGGQSQKGVLSGDSTVTTLAALLRSVSITKYRDSATDNTLAYLGLTHDKNGVMTFDSSKLNSALTANSSVVTSLLDEMSTSMEASLQGYISTIIPARKEGYQKSVKSIQKSEEDLDRRLQMTEAALRKKFTALDSLLSKLQGTNNYLTQQMDLTKKIYG